MGTPARERQASLDENSGNRNIGSFDWLVFAEENPDRVKELPQKVQDMIKVEQAKREEAERQAPDWLAYRASSPEEAAEKYEVLRRADRLADWNKTPQEERYLAAARPPKEKPTKEPVPPPQEIVVSNPVMAYNMTPEERAQLEAVAAASKRRLRQPEAPKAADVFDPDQVARQKKIFENNQAAQQAAEAARAEELRRRIAKQTSATPFKQPSGPALDQPLEGSQARNMPTVILDRPFNPDGSRKNPMVRGLDAASRWVDRASAKISKLFG